MLTPTLGRTVNLSRWHRKCCSRCPLIVEKHLKSHMQCAILYLFSIIHILSKLQLAAVTPNNRPTDFSLLFCLLFPPWPFTFCEHTKKISCLLHFVHLHHLPSSLLLVLWLFPQTFYNRNCILQISQSRSVMQYVYIVKWVQLSVRVPQRHWQLIHSAQWTAS